MTQSVFLAAGDGAFTATELARGPWDPGAQHGGAPAALLIRAFEALPASLLIRAFEALPASENLMITRVTYEFMRPVPLGQLHVQAQVVRPGRRVQLLEASLSTPQGGEVVRARALQIQRADSDAAGPPEGRPALGPEQGEVQAPRLPQGEMPFFGTEAMEIRFVSGHFNEPGPATAWFRLKVPLVAGEEPSALQRLAAAGDFGNGISACLSWEEWMFINPDLTLYVERPPAGEWICLDSQTVIGRQGVGVAEGVLYDRDGRVGRAIQGLLIARR